MLHFNFHYAYDKNRSSRPEVFCKKGVLRNSTEFTGNHLCQSLFLNKELKKVPASGTKHLVKINLPESFPKIL